MKSRAFKVVGLFFVMGVVSGLLSSFIGSLSVAWMWLGLGAILLLGLLISITVASRLRWFSLSFSVPRYISAALIVITAYPVSVLVMIGSSLLYGRLYGVLFSDRWHQRFYSGDDPAVNEGIIIGLYPAAIVGAVLVSLALRVVTKKWDKHVLLLLMIAGVGTIPLSQATAFLIGERNWQLLMFPVGEALFGAVCGYWLLRAGAVQDQDVLSTGAPSEAQDHLA